MRNLYILLLLSIASLSYSQDSSSLLDHYEKYYEQMKSQADVQGVINALTHLNVLEPNQSRVDTLALNYLRFGMYHQAISTIGSEIKESDSNVATYVKAESLYALNSYEQALPHYEKLFKTSPTAGVAYVLSEIKLNSGDLLGATKNITFGIANSIDTNRIHYDIKTGSNYQVPIKASFLVLKGVLKYTEDRENNADLAIQILNQALEIAPNFPEAISTIDAINSQRDKD